MKTIAVLLMCLAFYVAGVMTSGIKEFYKIEDQKLAIERKRLELENRDAQIRLQEAIIRICEHDMGEYKDHFIHCLTREYI